MSRGTAVTQGGFNFLTVRVRNRRHETGNNRGVVTKRVVRLLKSRSLGRAEGDTEGFEALVTILYIGRDQAHKARQRAVIPCVCVFMIPLAADSAPIQTRPNWLRVMKIPS